MQAENLSSTRMFTVPDSGWYASALRGGSGDGIEWTASRRHMLGWSHENVKDWRLRSSFIHWKHSLKVNMELLMVASTNCSQFALSTNKYPISTFSRIILVACPSPVVSIVMITGNWSSHWSLSPRMCIVCTWQMRWEEWVKKCIGLHQW